MSAGKFALVVLFFMHLRYDKPLLTTLFAAPLLIAVGHRGGADDPLRRVPHLRALMFVRESTPAVTLSWLGGESMWMSWSGWPCSAWSYVVAHGSATRGRPTGGRVPVLLRGPLHPRWWPSTARSMTSATGTSSAPTWCSTWCSRSSSRPCCLLGTPAWMADALLAPARCSSPAGAPGRALLTRPAARPRPSTRRRSWSGTCRRPTTRRCALHALARGRAPDPHGGRDARLVAGALALHRCSRACTTAPSSSTCSCSACR